MILPSKLLRCFRYPLIHPAPRPAFGSLHRWPFLASSSSSTSISTHAPIVKEEMNVLEEWKKLYIKRHREVSATASAVAKFVGERSRSESLQIGDYLQAVEDLGAMRFGFEDVQMFLFKPQLNVLLNLVGVHYCLTCLGIRGDDLLEALKACEISYQRVRIKWWEVGRWFYGFRTRNQSHSRWVSLADLATEDGEHILGVLHRGAIPEVLHVQISAARHTSTPGSCRVAHINNVYYWQQVMDLVNHSGKFSKKFEKFTGTDGPLGKRLNNSTTRQEIGWESKYSSFSHFLETIRLTHVSSVLKSSQIQINACHR